MLCCTLTYCSLPPRHTRTTPCPMPHPPPAPPCLPLTGPTCRTPSPLGASSVSLRLIVVRRTHRSRCHCWGQN